MAESSTPGKKRKLSQFEPDNSAGQPKQGDIHLYPVSIKIPNEELLAEVKGVLRNTKDHKIPHAIRRFSNCLFGDYKQQVRHLRKRTKRRERWKSGPSTKKNFGLPKDARTRVKKFPVVRNLCQKVGITIACREYDLNYAAPFEISDILSIQPVVKHSVPFCSEDKDLMEIGKIKFAEVHF